MKTLKIVKILSSRKKAYFPIGLITKMYKHNDKIISIYSKSDIVWGYPVTFYDIEFIDATSQEKFLFYLNYEKPFVLEEKL